MFFSGQLSAISFQQKMPADWLLPDIRNVVEI
jgi:hypothetical protein